MFFFEIILPFNFIRFFSIYRTQNEIFVHVNQFMFQFLYCSQMNSMPCFSCSSFNHIIRILPITHMESHATTILVIQSFIHLSKSFRSHFRIKRLNHYIQLLMSITHIFLFQKLHDLQRLFPRVRLFVLMREKTHVTNTSD